jgi:hypothetical protein
VIIWDKIIINGGGKNGRFSYDIIAQTGGIVIIWDKIIINGKKI